VGEVVPLVGGFINQDPIAEFEGFFKFMKQLLGPPVRCGCRYLAGWCRSWSVTADGPVMSPRLNPFRDAFDPFIQVARLKRVKSDVVAADTDLTGALTVEYPGGKGNNNGLRPAGRAHRLSQFQRNPEAGGCSSLRIRDSCRGRASSLMPCKIIENGLKPYN